MPKRVGGTGPCEGWAARSRVRGSVVRGWIRGVGVSNSRLFSWMVGVTGDRLAVTGRGSAEAPVDAAGGRSSCCLCGGGVDTATAGGQGCVRTGGAASAAPGREAGSGVGAAGAAVACSRRTRSRMARSRARMDSRAMRIRRRCSDSSNLGRRGRSLQIPRMNSEQTGSVMTLARLAGLRLRSFSGRRSCSARHSNRTCVTDSVTASGLAGARAAKLDVSYLIGVSIRLAIRRCVAQSLRARALMCWDNPCLLLVCSWQAGHRSASIASRC